MCKYFFKEKKGKRQYVYWKSNYCLTNGNINFTLTGRAYLKCICFFYTIVLSKICSTHFHEHDAILIVSHPVLQFFTLTLAYINQTLTSVRNIYIWRCKCFFSKQLDQNLKRFAFYDTAAIWKGVIYTVLLHSTKKNLKPILFFVTILLETVQICQFLIWINKNSHAMF